MEAAEDLLAKYKKHPFAKGLLPFQATMASLGAPGCKVFAQQESRQRWVICDKETGQPALFSHAAVYAEGDHMETGNYVPPEESVPFGVDPRNVQRRANARCFYTYIFDTFTDISLYEGLWSLDEYMNGIADFNPRAIPRRAYLSGQDVRYRSRFWMQTPMFLRKGPQDDRSDGTSHLHAWVVDADRQSKGFRGNPDRPRVWVKGEGGIVPISERETKTLQRGDVLAVSFTVTYHITSTYWFPQYHPADLVVLKSGDGEVADYSAPAIDLHKRPPPTFEVEGGMEDEHVGSSRAPNAVIREDSAAMEDVLEVGLGSKGDDREVQESLERMEVDESGAVVGRGLSDTLGSAGDSGSGVREGFELLNRGGEDAEDDDEEFVDVGALEDANVRKAGGGRTGRSSRRRL